MKVASITGASCGLGHSMALRLAADGIDVIGTFRGARDEADEVAAGIVARGSRAAMLQLDLAEASTFPDFALRSGRDSRGRARQGRPRLREDKPWCSGRHAIGRWLDRLGPDLQAPFERLRRASDRASKIRDQTPLALRRRRPIPTKRLYGLETSAATRFWAYAKTDAAPAEDVIARDETPADRLQRRDAFDPLEDPKECSAVIRRRICSGWNKVL